MTLRPAQIFFESSKYRASNLIFRRLLKQLRIVTGRRFSVASIGELGQVRPTQGRTVNVWPNAGCTLECKASSSNAWAAGSVHGPATLSAGPHTQCRAVRNAGPGGQMHGHVRSNAGPCTLKWRAVHAQM